MMPPDDDALLIGALPAGTRVAHWGFGPGVVTDDGPQHGQVPVRFDGCDHVTYCYPLNLDIE
jgi:hypothetical protein